MKKLIILSLSLFIGVSLSISQTNLNDMKEFEKITWEELNYNAPKLIGSDWMLISAGSIGGGFNMMTASWGNLGWLWQKPVSIIYVRPQRHTHKFTEKEAYYTLTFYKEEFRDTLKLMGTVSGRDYDKINKSGLSPVATENNSVAFKEAYLIIECRKLYSSVIQEDSFIDQSLRENMYPTKDYHTMYIGEISNIWRKKE